MRSPSASQNAAIFFTSWTFHAATKSRSARLMASSAALLAAGFAAMGFPAIGLPAAALAVIVQAARADGARAITSETASIGTITFRIGSSSLIRARSLHPRAAGGAGRPHRLAAAEAEAT